MSTIAEIIRRSSAESAHRAERRKMARDIYRTSQDPNERTAVLRAEGGFGVVAIMTMCRVPDDVARLLVTGEGEIDMDKVRR